jgi:hypothetical protein
MNHCLEKKDENLGFTPDKNTYGIYFVFFYTIEENANLFTKRHFIFLNFHASGTNFGKDSSSPQRIPSLSSSLFCVTSGFLDLDPDPDPWTQLMPDPIRIRVLSFEMLFLSQTDIDLRCTLIVIGS